MTNSYGCVKTAHHGEIYNVINAIYKLTSQILASANLFRIVGHPTIPCNME